MLDELKGSSYAFRRVTFDNYMMQQAIQHGAKLNLAELKNIERNPDRTFTVTTSTGIGTNATTTKADLIVGAFGVDPVATACFTQTFNYHPPEYMQTIITKRHPSPEFLTDFGPRIHAFLPPLRDIEFGAITPKVNHLSITIAGKHLSNDTMKEFLALPQLARLLPTEYSEKGLDVFYTGRFPTSPAANFYADNMVVIGDASGMLRPFKGKGVNSAILGAIAATQTIMNHGPTAQNFHDYYLAAFSEITDDIQYARAARFLTNLMANIGAIDSLIVLAKHAPTIQHALTSALSGANPYKAIIKEIVRDPTIWFHWPAVINQLRRTKEFREKSQK
jgi:flavin-dependent dehydrogenase